MKRLPFIQATILILSILMVPHAAARDAIPWNIKALSVAPKVFDDPQHGTADVKAIFYQGLPWKGHSTRVFAYYGLPKLGH